MPRHRGSDGVDVIRPITNAGAEDDHWPNAVWIGEIDEADLTGVSRLTLSGGESFSRARLLVWSGGQPRGFIDLDVSAGVVDVASATAQITELPSVPTREAVWNKPPVTVAVCTRDRPDQLRDVLQGLAELDYPHFELLVVDNNPTSGLTPPVVEDFKASTDIRVHIVEAQGQGLSIARNVAIRSAEHDIVAFTDDDVLVDDSWLANLAHGFSRDPRVACVCGMVPSAELVTPAQSYFDRRVGWASGCEPAVFDLAAPPPDDPLFPMRVAQFGTGANFAVRRDVLIELGGFDEGLGIGSPAGGGEDIDIFVRILVAGHLLVREPAAVVWHRHRRTAADLEVQVHNYGLGLGAWIAKLGSRPRTFGMALRRVRPAVKHMRHVTVVEQEANGPADPELEALYGHELKGVLHGPFALLSARVAGRKAMPLSVRSSKLLRAFDVRGDRHWGDPENAMLAGRLSLAAVAVGLIGALGAISALPTVVLAVAVGAFMLAGPGSLALSWYTRMPTSVLLLLIPAVSIAVCLITVSGLLMLGFYDPVAVLLGLATVTVVGGLAHCGYLAQRQTVTAS
ncbi:glycosyltransferase family 2 protein [Mycobacterium sp. URHB0044]|uniref:glycosyltransferase family 2 protein n=1 Tax=Mycobacterium sp. URHB0044 TaxID=1380386 RepID=UPI0009E09849|nr:glycosyltransferase family A protein [Mycobacterium sp. URHB0044]